MIVNEQFLKKLRSIFDLNIYEVKIWTALLSRGVASAGELADISNVPRSRSYDVLESLEKKGFIVMKLGKPIKYLAVKPEEILKRVKKKIETEAKDQITALNDVKETSVFEEIDLLFNQGIDKLEPSDLSGVLKGRKNVYEHLKTIISNAEKTVFIQTTEKTLLSKLDTLKNVLKKAKARGVKVKIVAPVKELSFLSKEIRELAEFRSCDETKARFMIVDGQELMFMLADDQEVHEAYDLGIWVNTPYFAQSLTQLFEMNWKSLKRL
ncbi:TrmB family transcriptional regulator [archaeon]|jgi:HTH-type transcriptional regulator, sugar sensing transcriptional regulator|nr:TrmB family transcriptional regulator [archaeon]MBT4417369.1 TrmB family transcriptional regulator [archaeon]